MTKGFDLQDRIQRYNKTEDPYKRCLIYGFAGSGKTHFAGTWPNPFFIDTDRGGLTLRNQDIPYVTIEKGERAYDIITSIFKALKEGAAPFDELQPKTLVIDSVTALGEMMLYETMKFPAPGQLPKDPTKSKPEWDHYNALGARLQDIFTLAKDLPCNVVVTAGVKLERDEILGSFIGKPQIVGGYRTQIAHDFDEEYYLHSEGEGEKAKYYLFPYSWKYFEGKSRWGFKQRIENPTYEKLYTAKTSNAG